MSLASPLDSLESPQTVASLGTDSLPSPYDSASLYTNAFAQLSGSMVGKQPPTYEESAALNTFQALGLDGVYPGFNLPYQHQVCHGFIFHDNSTLDVRDVIQLQ